MSGYAEGVEEVTLKNSEDSYSNQRIAMFSTGGTVDNYSDVGGSYYNHIRILWIATDNGDGTFADRSGLTGKGWYNDSLSYPYSPLAGLSDEQIYNSIFGTVTPGNLNDEFSSWASSSELTDDQKNDFVFDVLYSTGCVDVTWGGGE